jgi:hypothetical protein
MRASEGGPIVVVKESEDAATRETVFVLTVMWLDAQGCEPTDRSKRRYRTWGWFPTLELAEKAVVTNDADIYEDGYYNVAILEEMTWGSLAFARAEHWYSATPIVADGRITGYDVQAIEKPVSLQGVVSFGMG